MDLNNGFSSNKKQDEQQIDLIGKEQNNNALSYVKKIENEKSFPTGKRKRQLKYHKKKREKKKKEELETSQAQIAQSQFPNITSSSLASSQSPNPISIEQLGQRSLSNSRSSVSSREQELSDIPSYSGDELQQSKSASGQEQIIQNLKAFPNSSNKTIANNNHLKTNEPISDITSHLSKNQQKEEDINQKEMKPDNQNDQQTQQLNDKQEQKIEDSNQQQNNKVLDTNQSSSSFEQGQLQTNTQTDILTYFNANNSLLENPSIPQLQKQRQYITQTPSTLPLSTSLHSLSSLSSSSPLQSQYQNQFMMQNKQYLPQFNQTENANLINNMNKQINSQKSINNDNYSPFQVSLSQFQSPAYHSNKSSQSSLLERSPSIFHPIFDPIYDPITNHISPYQQYNSSPMITGSPSIQQIPITPISQTSQLSLSNQQSSIISEAAYLIQHSPLNISMPSSSIAEQNIPFLKLASNPAYIHNTASYSSPKQLPLTTQGSPNNKLLSPITSSLIQGQSPLPQQLQQIQFQQQQQILQKKQQYFNSQLPPLSQIDRNIQKIDYENKIQQQQLQQELLLQQQTIISQQSISNHSTHSLLSSNSSNQSASIQFNSPNTNISPNQITNNNVNKPLTQDPFPNNITQLQKQALQLMSQLQQQSLIAPLLIPPIIPPATINQTNTQFHVTLPPFPNIIDKQQSINQTSLQQNQIQNIQLQNYNQMQGNNSLLPQLQYPSPYGNNIYYPNQIGQYKSQSYQKDDYQQDQYSPNQNIEVEQEYQLNGPIPYRKMKHTQKQRFVYQGKKEEAVKTTTEFCYHCGQLGHLFNRCPYHALTQAKTPEELQLVEQEIQKARLAVGGQGWRGAVNRIENKITPDNLQNNTQEESQKQDQLPSKGNITFEVEPNACFRCGKTGHTSKQCTFQDNRVCFTCGGIGHVQKQCPIQHSYKEEKKRSRNENQ